jgi:DNA end-binding protein Ku
MLPRSTWKGNLKLGHVSCAVAMFNATTQGERIALRKINERTGNPLEQQMVDAVTRDVVPQEQTGRGYEVAEDVFVYLTDDEIDALKIESTGTLDIEHFVSADEIDPVYMDGPYYVAPDDRVSDDAFSLIRDVMVRSGKFGIARTVISRRERLMVLQPRGKGILASTLRYPYEVRSDGDIFATIQSRPVEPEVMELALKVVARKTKRFKPKRYEDRFEKALIALIKTRHGDQAAKRATRLGSQAHAPVAEALRLSLKEASRKPRKPKQT